MDRCASLDIAVIGAGIVGTSCAYFLQEDGHRVTLIDPRAPGGGTSLGNAGVISVGTVLPIATPGMLRKVPGLLRDRDGPLAIRWRYLPRLLPWLARFVLASRPPRVEELSRAIAALTARADAAHDALIQQCGLGELVRSVGWLKVAYSRAALDRATGLDRRYYERYGRAYQLLDRAALRDLEPALDPRLEAGLLLPHNRAIRDPERYVAGIARAFFTRGGRQLRTEALELEGCGDRVEAVLTAAGRCPVDGVVIAAGAFSRRLVAQAGAPVPLDAERGYHLMLPHPEPTLSRPVYTVDHGFVLAPMDHGLRLTGGVELASPWAPPDYRRIRRLVPLAQRLVPGLRAEITSEWLGHRPSLPDSLPVIGRAPRRRNVWLAFGHQHVGLTLGPLTGRLVADLVAGRDPGLDLAPYRADRRYH